MSYLDYKDRSVDLLAFASATDQYAGNQQMLLSLTAYASGQLCTGPLKLAQTALLRLLTEAGSIPALPNEGCRFITEMRQGLLRTITDVAVAFSAAVADIKQQFIREEADGDPDDERFGEMRLTGVKIVSDTLYIKVSIVSLAGPGVTIITPLKTSLGGI